MKRKTNKNLIVKKTNPSKPSTSTSSSFFSRFSFDDSWKHKASNIGKKKKTNQSNSKLFNTQCHNFDS